MDLIQLRSRCCVVVARAVLAAGCAPRPIPLAAEHPANPDAEPGRLAGSPAALRPDVAQVDEPQPRSTATPSHDHEGHGAAGFEPQNITVPRGKPVVLRFERRIERTCGTEVVMVVDSQKIVKDLPLNKPVEVAIMFGTAGTVKYSCAMDMIRGTITVQ